MDRYVKLETREAEVALWSQVIELDNPRASDFSHLYYLPVPHFSRKKWKN